MLARPLAVGEPSVVFNDEIDSEILPGQLFGIFRRENLDRLAVNQDPIFLRLDGALEHAMDRIVLEQMRERLCVGEVVDCDELEFLVVQRRTKYVPSDAAEAINADPYGHGICPLDDRMKVKTNKKAGPVEPACAANLLRG